MRVGSYKIKAYIFHKQSKWISETTGNSPTIPYPEPSSVKTLNASTRNVTDRRYRNI